MHTLTIFINIRCTFFNIFFYLSTYTISANQQDIGGGCVCVCVWGGVGGGGG